MEKRILFLLLTIALLPVLLNCSSSSSVSGECTRNTEPSGITDLELRDPVSCAGDSFGQSVVVLSNGNVVVSDPNDSSKKIENGAVHLYEPATQKLIASFFGSSEEEELGWYAVTALSNNNFVINSPFRNVDGKKRAGAVILVDGNTGTQIGETLSGNSDRSFLGLNGIFALSNNNFVIASSGDNVGGIDNTGSVRLIDGTSNLQIGNPIIGGAGEFLGSRGVTVLANNNYVISNAFSEENGIVEAGFVTLVSGVSGNTIGSPIVGDAPNDNLGGGGITVLPNNYYVILSFNDDDGGNVDVGSIKVVNGGTGVEISSAALGSSGDDFSRFGNVTSLTNGNFVLALPAADSGGIQNAGIVSLFDGLTGNQIGSSITGDDAQDAIGSVDVIALSNGNYLVESSNLVAGGGPSTFSLMLVDGSTGNLIDATNTGFSWLAVALPNSNYVVPFSNANVNGKVSSGMVKLFDGNTGVQIGSSAVGDEGDSLGSGGLAALANNKVAILSPDDNDSAQFNVGSIILMDGTTANILGDPVFGQSERDFSNVNIRSLSGDKFVAISDSYTNPDTKEVVDAALLIDGTTNDQIGDIILGRPSSDFSEDDFIESSFTVTDLNTIDYFVLALNGADANGLQNSGFVGLVKKTQ